MNQQKITVTVLHRSNMNNARQNAYSKYSASETRSWRVRKFTISRVACSRVNGVTTVVRQLVTLAHARDEINSTVYSWSSLASSDDTLFTQQVRGVMLYNATPEAVDAIEWQYDYLYKEVPSHEANCYTEVLALTSQLK